MDRADIADQLLQVLSTIPLVPVPLHHYLLLPLSPIKPVMVPLLDRSVVRVLLRLWVYPLPLQPRSTTRTELLVAVVSSLSSYHPLRRRISNLLQKVPPLFQVQLDLALSLSTSPMVNKLDFPILPVLLLPVHLPPTLSIISVLALLLPLPPTSSPKSLSLLMVHHRLVKLNLVCHP